MGNGGLRYRFQLDPDFLARNLELPAGCRVRLAEEVDVEQMFGTVQSLLVSRGCRLQTSALYKGKRQLEFFLNIPAELDLRKLELDLRAMLPKANDARITMDVV